MSTEDEQRVEGNAGGAPEESGVTRALGGRGERFGWQAGRGLAWRGRAARS